MHIGLLFTWSLFHSHKLLSHWEISGTCLTDVYQQCQSAVTHTPNVINYYQSVLFKFVLKTCHSSTDKSRRHNIL